MSLILRAPVPGIVTTTVLPNPQFNDTQARKVELQIMRSMNGTRYTYVKSNDRQALSFTFLLTRKKALELRAFLVSYYRAKVQLTDHEGAIWEGYFTNNPFEFSTAGRANGWPGGEYCEITLQLEAEQVN